MEDDKEKKIPLMSVKTSGVVNVSHLWHEQQSKDSHFLTSKQIHYSITPIVLKSVQSLHPL